VREANKEARIAAELQQRGLSIKLKVEPSWYFR
jgi:hypothetical protein